jgi:hypothetical protein
MVLNLLVLAGAIFKSPIMIPVSKKCNAQPDETYTCTDATVKQITIKGYPLKQWYKFLNRYIRETSFHEVWLKIFNQ